MINTCYVDETYFQAYFRNVLKLNATSYIRFIFNYI